MRVTLYIFLFFAFHLTTYGQQIKGTIIDQITGEPIEGATVQLLKQKIGAISNAKGDFNLNTKIHPTDVFVFSHASYLAKTLTYEKMREINFIVGLTEKSEELSEIKLRQIVLQDKLSLAYLPPMPKGVYDFPSLVYQNKIYAFGGNTSVFRDEPKIALEKISTIPNPTLADLLKASKMDLNWETYDGTIQVFDFMTQQWHQQKSTIKPKAFHNAERVGTDFYVFSGRQLSTNRRQELLVDDIEIINSETADIVVDKTNPHQASNASSFVYEGTLIVLGGSIKVRTGGTKKYSNQVHFLNAKTGLWYTLDPMLSEKETSGILVGDAYYTFGGEHINPIANIDKLDLISGQWTSIGRLFEATKDMSLAQVNGKIYGYVKGRIIVFNVRDYSLIEYAIDTKVESPQLQTDGEYLYVFGGYTEENFTKTPSKLTARIGLDQFAKTKILREKKLDR